MSLSPEQINGRPTLAVDYHLYHPYGCHGSPKRDRRGPYSGRMKIRLNESLTRRQRIVRLQQMVKDSGRKDKRSALGAKISTESSRHLVPFKG